GQYCMPGEVCWPCGNDIIAFRDSLDGNFYNFWNDGYDDASFVKNWDYITKPAFVVRANTTADIQKSILFARRFHIRMSFLSSGHDYIGRSTALGSLMVRMDNLREITIFPEDSTSPSGASMIAQTGINWGSLYEQIDSYGLMAVGGSSHGVAMGGWFMGGGHSPITRSYGLGVDNILSYRVVLVDGRIANVSAAGIRFEDDTIDPDTDLWWALRGGAGGTFAIATHFHFQLHRQPSQFVSFGLAFPLYHPSDGTFIGEQVMDFWHNYLATNLSNTWGGYIFYHNQDFSEDYNQIVRGRILFALLHAGPYEQAEKTINDLLAFHPEWRLPGNWVRNYTTFWGYSESNADDLNGPTYIVNRFVQPADLVGPGITPLTRAFKNYYAQDEQPLERIITCTHCLVGEKSTEIGTADTAVHPGFRSALISLTCGWGWLLPDGRENVYGYMKNFTQELYQIGEGVYVNEPDHDLVNWKTDYWGSNYARLLEIKQKYDPERFFTCLNCVGSDLPYTGRPGPNIHDDCDVS
ncbi:unnamed protein product, partial [Owenia fusiformis]